jgi:hypothetical protein
LRCFLFRNGHFADFEFLTPGSDEALIEQAKRVFRELRADRRFDGFEVWDGGRRVHVHHEEMRTSEPFAGLRSKAAIVQDKPSSPSCSRSCCC